jgi:hypothetical protein
MFIGILSVLSPLGSFGNVIIALLYGLSCTSSQTYGCLFNQLTVKQRVFGYEDPIMAIVTKNTHTHTYTDTYNTTQTLRKGNT